MNQENPVEMAAKLARDTPMVRSGSRWAVHAHVHRKMNSSGSAPCAGLAVTAKIFTCAGVREIKGTQKSHAKGRQTCPDQKKATNPGGKKDPATHKKRVPGFPPR